MLAVEGTAEEFNVCCGRAARRGCICACTFVCLHIGILRDLVGVFFRGLVLTSWEGELKGGLVQKGD